MIMRFLFAVAVCLLAAACTVNSVPPPAKHFILTGSSTDPTLDTNSRAVTAAQAALTAAEQNGCRPVSIGGGAGIGFGMCSSPSGDCIESGAQVHSVHLLVACPPGGPDLNPNGTIAGTP